MIIQIDRNNADVTCEARSVLAVHRPAPDSLCEGCMEIAGSLAWFPCPQARWAQQILHTADLADTSLPKKSAAADPGTEPSAAVVVARSADPNSLGALATAGGTV